MLKLLLSLLFISCSFLQAADTKPEPAQPAHEAPANPPGIVPQDTAPSAAATTHTYESAFVKMLVTLGLLLILVFFTYWMFRRLTHGRMKSLNLTRSIKIVEKRPLSPKTILYLLEIGGKQILIAESQFEVRHLSNFEETPAMPEEDS